MNPIKMIALSILVAAVVSGCGSASIEERNAAAKAAVSYPSGAAFVKALEQAGVPCPNPRIDPITVQGIDMNDLIRCNYAEDDFVDVNVYLPLWVKISNDFSALFLSHAKSTEWNRFWLKGEYWFAWSINNDQRLFNIQEAIGGQLVIVEYEGPIPKP